MSLDINEELMLFIIEAKRLLTKSFFVNFLKNDVCISDIQDFDTSPSEDSSEAYALHLRKFFQKKERVSLVKINKYIRDISTEKSSFLLEWQKMYECMESMLESSSLFGRIKIDDINISEHITLEQLFTIKIYGDLFHLDKDKIEKLTDFTNTTAKKCIFNFEYLNFLFEAGEIIGELAEICSKNIPLLDSNTKT